MVVGWGSGWWWWVVVVRAVQYRGAGGCGGNPPIKGLSPPSQIFLAPYGHFYTHPDFFCAICVQYDIICSILLQKISDLAAFVSKTRLSSIVSQPKKVVFVVDVVFVVVFVVFLGVIFVAVLIIVGPKLNSKFSQNWVSNR